MSEVKFHLGVTSTPLNYRSPLIACEAQVL